LKKQKNSIGGGESN